MTDRSNQTPRRAAAYMRVSTSRQANHETSLDAQDGIIMRSAEAAGYAIAERYVEGGRSARTDRRPVFQRMIADACAKPQRYGAIYILNFSRFFRDRPRRCRNSRTSCAPGSATPTISRCRAYVRAFVGEVVMTREALTVRGPNRALELAVAGGEPGDDQVRTFMGNWCTRQDPNL